MKKLIISVLSLMTIASAFGQQERHFSMFYASPSLLNPAATATMAEDYRLFTNFRMQWLTASPVPFRTNSFSGEVKLFKDRFTNGYIGTGLHFTNDATGDARVMTNQASIPINYVLEIGRENMISVGVLPGFYQQSLSGTQTWDSQWNGIGFDQSIPAGEGYAGSVSQFDIGSGIYYQHRSIRTGGLFQIGASANHLTGQPVNFTALTTNLYRQYVGHMVWNVRFENSNKGFSPMAYAFFQGPNRNIVFGASLDFLLQQASRRTDFLQEKSLSFGLYHRLNDALIAAVNFKYAGFQVGISYDATISQLRTATNTVGAFEIFLKYASFYGNRRRYIH